MKKKMATRIKNNISEILTKKSLIKQFCKKNGIVYLGIFGSFVNNSATDTSDIDFLIKYKHTGGLLEFIRAERELSSIFQRKVDLVEEKGIPKDFKKKIKKEVIPIYEK